MRVFHLRASILPLLLPLLASAAACKGKNGEEDGGTKDVSVSKGDKGDNAYTPRTCMIDGKVHVVWYGDNGNRTSIYYNVSGDGGTTWLPADVKLNTGDGDAVNPSIACAEDFVYVVWEDSRDGKYGYHNIYANVSDNAGRDWLEEDVLLDGDVEGDFMSLAPQVVAAGDNAYVTWFDAVNGAYDIFVQSTTNEGRDWRDTPRRVDTDEAGSAYSANPQIATDGEGNIIVVWEDRRDGASDIYANYSTDRGDTFFDDDERLDGGDDNGSADSFLPEIAMDGNGAYVVWHDNRAGEKEDIYFNYTDNKGDSWPNEATRVDSDAEGLFDSQNPDVAVGKEGRVHVVWQDDRSGGYDILYRATDNFGEDWVAEEIRLDGGAAGEAQSYEPVISASGETVVVGWKDYRNDNQGDGTNDLFYNYSQSNGDVWSSDDYRINSTAPGITYAVDLSVGAIGTSLVAVWADGRDETSRIYAATRELGEASVYIAPEVEEEE